jgi:hypothetical protein
MTSGRGRDGRSYSAWEGQVQADVQEYQGYWQWKRCTSRQRRGEGEEPKVNRGDGKLTPGFSYHLSRCDYGCRICAQRLYKMDHRPNEQHGNKQRVGTVGETI